MVRRVKLLRTEAARCPVLLHAKKERAALWTIQRKMHSDLQATHCVTGTKLS